MKIVLHTEQHPEDNAMLQALYSRSAESVTDHIEKLKNVGSGKFMAQYYLGYGHASIADCGVITVYAEGISMLAAKAIQDSPLYNGQESSSRYIDWSAQPFYNPFIGTALEEPAQNLLGNYREFYVGRKEALIENLKERYPKKEDEKQTIYDKAIAARAFDILRGFLPCGATTNVSWTTSLRKANEHLSHLSAHPLKEVREVAAGIHAALIEAYPSSIAPLISYEDIDPYFKDSYNFYFDVMDGSEPGFEIAEDLPGEPTISCNREYPNRDSQWFLDRMTARPRKAAVQRHLNASRSRLEIDGVIDFGSFRDLQRHRGGYCAMPIVATSGQLHRWYFDELDGGSLVGAVDLISNISAFARLACDAGNSPDSETVVEYEKNLEFLLQYMLPMGTQVSVSLDYDIAQAIYVAELRSGQTVHSTLRPFAQTIAKYLQREMAIPVYADMAQDSWNTRRGTQDITPNLV